VTIRIAAACFLVSLLLAAARGGPVQEPPRGPAAAAPGPESPPVPAGEQNAEPVVGQLEHSGWGLVGSGGRHYVFGGLAVADCLRSGQRHIVALQQEEPTLLPKPDDNFLYYRELGTGHRWAIGRYPQADVTYLVYFQPQTEQPAAAESQGAARPRWTLFHRARLIWPEEVGGTAGSEPQISPMTQRKKASRLCAP
jgi:hypothetical protein